MAWLDKVKEFLKYAPAIWVAIKIAWTLYKAKIRSDGYREALKDEQRKRVAAEASLALRERLADGDDARLERLRREREARK